MHIIRLLRIAIPPLLLSSLLNTSAAADGTVSVSERRTAIVDVVNTFVSAWNSNNIEQLLSLFTEDGDFLSPTGADARSRPEIRQLLAREHRDLFTGTTLSAQPQKIEFPQQGQAVARGSYTLEGVNVFLGFETSVQGPFTFRLMRKEGAWLIKTARISKG